MASPNEPPSNVLILSTDENSTHATSHFSIALANVFLETVDIEPRKPVLLFTRFEEFVIFC